MRIGVLSDCHADAKLFGVARYHEVENVVLNFVALGTHQRWDHALFLGDWCDPDSGVCVFRCMQLLVHMAASFRQVGIPLTCVAGNHDVIEDGSGATTLDPLHALGDSTKVFDRPGWRHLGKDLLLMALPFTASSHAYDPGEWLKETWNQHAPGRERVVVATHLGIEGVQPGEETKEMPRGREVLYPKEDVRNRGPQVVAQLAGHFHERQLFEGIQIVGAPARFAFGERRNEPGFLVVEV